MVDDIVIQPDSGLYSFAVILLHGSHSVGNEMCWIAGMMKEKLPNTVFLLPKGDFLVDEKNNKFSYFDESIYDQIKDHCSTTSIQLNNYIDVIVERYKLDFSNVILLGYSQGMQLVFGAINLRSTSQVGFVVGFSGKLPNDIEPINTHDLPSALIVHGEIDTAIKFSELSRSEVRLRNMGYDVISLSRPNVGHYIDVFSVDYVIEIIRHKFFSVSAAKKYNIKLIIWDLDDTLWKGTLAEGDIVQLNKNRVDIIKSLNNHGIVSAICSKNDFGVAKKILKNFGIWNDFVFPRISFSSKGPAVKGLIDDMRLLAKNVLFIDDNIHNLEEVKLFCPDILTIDANSDQCDMLLHEIYDDNKGINKRRVEKYKSLQKKVEERFTFDNNDEFLQLADIKICIVWRADVLDFSKRIEELINRTNQLNFTKSRVAIGSMDVFLSEPMLRESFAVFVWDKYGYHGLVGFVGVDIVEQGLLHMAFSCRIMHMGIESWVLNKVLIRFPKLNLPENFPVQPIASEWINEVHYTNNAVREFILTNESVDHSKVIPCLRIMANCQSGALAHYSGLRNLAEIDNFPRAFSLSKMLDDSYLEEYFPPFLVYGMFVDYFNSLWQNWAVSGLEHEFYLKAVIKFCEVVKEKGCNLLLIPTPRGMPEHYFHPLEGITPHRVNFFRDTWESVVVNYDFIEILQIESICEPKQMLDDTHFSIGVTRQIALLINEWYNEKSTLK